MKRLGFAATFLAMAFCASGACAAVNVLCRPQCVEAHQVCTSHCSDRKCAADCTNVFNACLKTCDQNGRYH